MHYVVYLLECPSDTAWYIGFTTNLKQRLHDHNSGHSPYTSKKKDWRLIYTELYQNKMDALGREQFLKSGAGRRFSKKQIKHYLEKGGTTSCAPRSLGEVGLP